MNTEDEKVYLHSLVLKFKNFHPKPNISSNETFNSRRMFATGPDMLDYIHPVQCFSCKNFMTVHLSIDQSNNDPSDLNSDTLYCSKCNKRLYKIYCSSEFSYVIDPFITNKQSKLGNQGRLDILREYCEGKSYSKIMKKFVRSFMSTVSAVRSFFEPFLSDINISIIKDGSNKVNTQKKEILMNICHGYDYETLLSNQSSQYKKLCKSIIDKVIQAAPNIVEERIFDKILAKAHIKLPSPNLKKNSSDTEKKNSSGSDSEGISKKNKKHSSHKISKTLNSSSHIKNKKKSFPRIKTPSLSRNKKDDE